jgi:hypothetical protein
MHVVRNSADKPKLSGTDGSFNGTLRDKSLSIEWVPVQRRGERPESDTETALIGCAVKRTARRWPENRFFRKESKANWSV